MELHNTKNDTHWFFARADEDTWVFFARPRGRGPKAARFNLLCVIQPDHKREGIYVCYGYISDAGGAMHWVEPKYCTRDAAEAVGQSYLDAAREADEDLLAWN